jgi:hypothetical protein
VGHAPAAGGARIAKGEGHETPGRDDLYVLAEAADVVDPDDRGDGDTGVASSRGRLSSRFSCGHLTEAPSAVEMHDRSVPLDPRLGSRDDPPALDVAHVLRDAHDAVGVDAFEVRAHERLRHDRRRLWWAAGSDEDPAGEIFELAGRERRHQL